MCVLNRSYFICEHCFLYIARHCKDNTMYVIQVNFDWTVSCYNLSTDALRFYFILSFSLHYVNAKTCFLYVLNLVLVWSVSMRWCRVLEVYSTYLMTRPVSLCLCDCPSYIVYACQYSRVYFNPHILTLLKHSINNNFKEP